MNNAAVILALVAAVSVVFGLLRAVLPVRGLDRRDVFKDLAHLWVGGLYGAALADWSWFLAALAVGLTVWEVVMFKLRKPSDSPTKEQV